MCEQDEISPQILNLCDVLLENIYNFDIYNTKNDDHYVKNWKDLRKNPNEVLKKAITYTTPDQRRIFNEITNPDNYKHIYMLSGLPGTGKSYLQTCINLHFRLQGKCVLSVAPTNLIAYQQKGYTIHSQIKDICKLINIRIFNCDAILLQKLYAYYNNIDGQKSDFEIKNIIKNLSLTELYQFIDEQTKESINFNILPSPQNFTEDFFILLDEGTMVSSTLFSLLYYCYPKAKYLITYGPNQLQPPTNNATSCNICIGKENPDAVNFYELKTQIRMKHNYFIHFVQCFSDILSGENVFKNEIEKINQMEFFFNQIKIGGTLQDYFELKDDKKILIVSTNHQRCQENNRRLQECEGNVYAIKTEMDDSLPENYDPESRLGIDKVLYIKKGVYCIIRMNDLNKNLIKGQIVKIIDIKTDDEGEVSSIIVIRIDDSKKKQICLEKMPIKTDYHLRYKKYHDGVGDDDDDDDDDNFAYITQFPITLSYSLTAHSAQGKTLDCNLGICLQHNSYNSESILNSYFVAITRVRNSEQLYMNMHPVCWMYPDMKIRNIQDLHEYKHRIINSRTGAKNFIETFDKKPIKNININDMKNIDSVIQYIYPH